MSKVELTFLEYFVALGVMRLEKTEAYGVAIRDEIEQRTGRLYGLSSIYSAVRRLETQGLVACRRGRARQTRGGRGKQLYRVTAAGRKTVRCVGKSVEAMMDGL